MLFVQKLANYLLYDMNCNMPFEFVNKCLSITDEINLNNCIIFRSYEINKYCTNRPNSQATIGGTSGCWVIAQCFHLACSSALLLT